jgi:hypothetical protein
MFLDALQNKFAKAKEIPEVFIRDCEARRKKQE